MPVLAARRHRQGGVTCRRKATTSVYSFRILLDLLDAEATLCAAARKRNTLVGQGEKRGAEASLLDYRESQN
jgi:hypothetical protein